MPIIILSDYHRRCSMIFEEFNKCNKDSNKSGNNYCTDLYDLYRDCLNKTK